MEEEAAKIRQAVAPTRQTWFSRMAQLFQRGQLDQALWDALEEALISADVGVATTERLLEAVKARVRQVDHPSPEDAHLALKEEMVRTLETPPAPPPELSACPRVVLVVGVNGVGKTTTIGKLARHFRSQGQRVLLAAADTFRAAATEQLQLWGERVGAEVVAHQPGADPGAVAFDALQAARSRDVDVVIVDTAGRLHTKVNLMEELKKVRRVLQRLDPQAPHEVLLVLDATTGQNGLLQARAFTEAVEVTGVILTKLDGTAKGGIALAICADLGLPLVFVGTGETPEDLAPFDPATYVDALLP
ncbi:MAG: signal recognition particle-docking protein FtsY [Chloroflexi bacterium]|nr:signal recognition particle-docking protein FtsY [Chloroflexota bacterium]